MLRGDKRDWVDPLDGLSELYGISTTGNTEDEVSAFKKRKRLGSYGH